MKVLQINTVVNSGSTGRIAEDIGKVLIANGHESYIAYGRESQSSKSNTIRIGGNADIYLHGIETLLFDNHGLSSRGATQQLVNKVKDIAPDIIHVHNLHGYYINFKILFECIEELDVPVVWTLHDCWAFTGHCAYFESTGCEKWQTQCNACPSLSAYPKTLGLDFSKRNFNLKKFFFNKPKVARVVTPSLWLKKLVEKSFLSNYQTQVVHNGIDIDVFNVIKKKEIGAKFKIIGVASTWDKRKGLADFVKLSSMIDMDDYEITLVGLNKKQLEALPANIKGLKRTESISELVRLYNEANVFINPTYTDNFPTTNIEALACGTPVITYNTGGSPEAIDEHTGFVLEKGDIEGIVEKVEKLKELKELNREELSRACRLRAETFFDKNDRFYDYLNIYNELLNEKQ